MAVLPTDIKFYYSGGAANADPLLSLGGDRSSVEVPGTLETLFDRVSSAEALSGDTEYRCIYVRQENVSATLLSAMFYIQTATSSVDTSLAIGLGSSAVNVSETVSANESAVPAGVTFGTPGAVGNPTTRADVVELGDLAPNDFIAVWLRRDVTAAAGAATDTANLRVSGDTI